MIGVREFWMEAGSDVGRIESRACANPSHKALRPGPSAKLRASMRDFLRL
jgi:hypothetical protein